MSENIEDQIRSVVGNIRKVRECRNYTQDYLAMKLGISQNSYSKIELAYTKITVEKLVQIAEILQVDLLDLLPPKKDRLVQLKCQHP